MTHDEKIVEAVARAICVAQGNDPDFDYDPNGVSDMPGINVCWKLYCKPARAAITAYQAEMKPVAWITTHHRFGSDLSDAPLTEADMRNGWSQTALYALPNPPASP